MASFSLPVPPSVIFILLTLWIRGSDAQKKCDSFVTGGHPSLCNEMQDFAKKEEEYSLLGAVGALKLKNKTFPIANTFEAFFDALVGFDEPLWPILLGPSVYYFFCIAVIFCHYMTKLVFHLLEPTKKKLLLHPETAKLPYLPLYWLQQSKREQNIKRENRNTWAWLAKKYMLSPNDPLLHGIDEALHNTTWEDFRIPRDTWSLINIVLQMNDLYVDVVDKKGNKIRISKAAEGTHLNPFEQVPKEAIPRDLRKVRKEKKRSVRASITTTDMTIEEIVSQALQKAHQIEGLEGAGPQEEPIRIPSKDNDMTKVHPEPYLKTKPSKMDHLADIVGAAVNRLSDSSDKGKDEEKEEKEKSPPATPIPKQPSEEIKVTPIVPIIPKMKAIKKKPKKEKKIEEVKPPEIVEEEPKEEIQEKKKKTKSKPLKKKVSKEEPIPVPVPVPEKKPEVKKIKKEPKPSPAPETEVLPIPKPSSAPEQKPEPKKKLPKHKEPKPPEEPEPIVSPFPKPTSAPEPEQKPPKKHPKPKEPSPVPEKKPEEPKEDSKRFDITSLLKDSSLNPKHAKSDKPKKKLSKESVAAIMKDFKAEEQKKRAERSQSLDQISTKKKKKLLKAAKSAKSKAKSERLEREKEEEEDKRKKMEWKKSKKKKVKKKPQSSGRMDLPPMLLREMEDDRWHYPGKPLTKWRAVHEEKSKSLKKKKK